MPALQNPSFVCRQDARATEPFSAPHSPLPTPHSSLLTPHSSPKVR
ncbi:hypothetical protein [Egbenema bharatensis]